MCKTDLCISSLFTLQMAHFYSIHIFEDSDYDNDIGYFKLYTTFEKACDAMDKMILEYIARLDPVVMSDFVFDEPDREPLRKEIETRDWVRYYYLDTAKFTICKATVVE
jgi:hypothetical protein